MKYTLAFILFLFAFAVPAGAQELRGVQLELVVSNDQGREQVLTLGVMEGATNGLDMHIGETELPPQPPNEIFDARCVSTPGASQLGTGSYVDYRTPGTGATFSYRYTIAYQAGINAQSVTLRWRHPYPGRITKVRIDDEDIAGKSEIESQFASGQFSIEISYDMSPLGFQATPNPVTFSVNNREPAPSVTLVVTPTGNAQALWSIDAGEADWLDIEPMSGEGQEPVVLTINTQTLPAGRYEGTLRIYSLSEPASLNVPIEMTMTVGVSDARPPSTVHLSQNYPNPFKPTTMIDVDLGTAALQASPTLLVYDLQGREIADLSSGLHVQPGVQTVVFDASFVAPGVYNYTLSYGDTKLTRSMIVVK